jgi:subtilase family serine protease
MALRNSYSCLALPLALLSCIAPVHAAAKDRISGRIDSTRKVTLLNSHKPVQAAGDADLGPVDPAMMISYARVALQPSAEQSAALEQLLEGQRDPSSPNYQRWLTPEEFADEFSVSENDANQVASWLRSQGFTVERVARARNWIAISGPASQFESAFQTEIHYFQGASARHFANATELKIPAALAGVVSEVHGLHDYLWHAPRLTNFGTVTPDWNSSSGAHYLAPDDLATIYDITPLYSAGFTGTGQKIAVVGQSDVTLSDISSFRSRFNLPASAPQMVLYGSDPGIRSGDSEESTLDLEWAGAVARGASLLFVYSTNVILSAEYVVDQNLAPVLSISYGGCEADNSSSLRSVVQQANAEGITWLASSGDSGAAACDSTSAKTATQGLAVNIPASIPEVTAVGGTTFNEGSGTYWSSTMNANGESVLSYIPETAWNDTLLLGTLAASGGGMSVLFAKPSWQSGTAVPADGARDVPDIAGTASPAHDAYLIVMNGSLSAVGGTSAPTPAYAGVMGLLNQYLLSKGTLSKAGLGNINPTLYHLAQTSSSIFHDVTTGSNIVPCTVGTKNCTSGSLGYSAGAGYDMVTGLGSLDVYALANGWSGSVSSSTGTSTTVAANPTTFAQNSSTVLTATVKPASGTTTPTGTVVFTSGSTTLGSASLVSGVAMLTVPGSLLGLGTHTVIASYGGSATFGGSSGSTTVSVTAAPATATTTTVASNPASFAQNASTVLTATVKPASGTTLPTGTVVFTSGSTTLGSVSLVSGVATLTVSGGLLAVGTDTITATYGGSTAFGGSSGTTQVSVTLAGGTASNVTATANPNPVTGVNGVWTFNVKLSDSGGATKVTGMTINGANYSSSITSWFGTNQLPAGGSLSVNLQVRGVTSGTKEVFVFSGTDPSGQTWSTTLAVTLN